MFKKSYGKNPKDKPQKKAESAVKAFVTDSALSIDPFGSYTGSPKGTNEKPVQDADDI